MEDWQKEFFEMIETATLTVEQFLQEVSQSLEETAEEITEEIFTDINQFWREFVEPIIEIDLEINVNHDLDIINRHFDNETNFPEELMEYPDFFLSPKIEPTKNVHAACIGCCYYHGRVYNGNLLVCGMHPYGWDDSPCPDWQE